MQKKNSDLVSIKNFINDFEISIEIAHNTKEQYEAPKEIKSSNSVIAREVPDIIITQVKDLFHFCNYLIAAKICLLRELYQKPSPYHALDQYKFKNCPQYTIATISSKQIHKSNVTEILQLFYNNDLSE